MPESQNLLIVEDEYTIRLLLEAFFKRQGYRVITAASAEEALRLIEEFPCNIGLVDLKLPGMSGVEFCRTVKKTNPMAVLFAMTGFTSLFELSETREAGFEDYFVKPVKLLVVLAAVEGAAQRIQRWRRQGYDKKDGQSSESSSTPSAS